MSDALAAFPVRPIPPLMAVTAPVVLVTVPAVVLVTLICTWQLLAPGGSVPFIRLILLEPATAPVTIPPQVLTRPGVAATVKPAGNGSLTARSVSIGLPAGLLMVSVS